MSTSELEELIKLMQMQLSREPERHQEQIDAQRQLMEEQAAAHNRQMEQMLSLVQSLSRTDSKATQSSTFNYFSGFEPGYELWPDYFQRFKTFLMAHSVSEEKRAHVFLMNQTIPIYKQLNNLALQQTPPKDINELSFEVIIDFMSKQYEPKRSLVSERFKFWNRIGRNPGEKIQDLAARIREDAATCDFHSIKDPLDDAMRTRFICSVDNEQILKALFRYKDDNLTFSRVIEIAQEIEEASIAAGGTAYLGQKAKRGDDSDDSSDSSDDLNDPYLCGRCGGDGHDTKNCRFKNLTCYSCNKDGHAAKMCKTFNKIKRKQKQKRNCKRKGRR